jgi:hypothetical protein
MQVGDGRDGGVGDSGGGLESEAGGEYVRGGKAQRLQDGWDASQQSQEGGAEAT